MTYAKYILSTLLLVLSITPAFALILLQNQPTDYGYGLASQNDINTGGYGNFASVYDDFTFNGSFEIKQIDWIGSYFNPPQAGTINAWTVNFYTDTGGQPGNPCCSIVVAGNANETFLQYDSVGNPVFAYQMNISGCCFDAGTQYWFSLVPDLGYPPQWGWETGSGGDGIAYQDFFSNRSQLNNDMAFQLWGVPCNATPEPGTLALLGTGVLGLGGLLRRRLRV